MGRKSYTTKALWNEIVVVRDELECVYCGQAVIVTKKRTRKSASLDHVKNYKNHPALRRDVANLICCCQRCNSRKKDLTIRKWFRKMTTMGYDMPAARRRYRNARARARAHARRLAA
jgi:5-methylcytosine-specific restriction endonuclease McrA